MGFADALQREADWFSSVVPGMPPMAVDQGGPWDLIVPYGRAKGTVPEGRKTLYVARESAADGRIAIQQRTHAYMIILTLSWPVRSKGSQPEDDMAALDQAIEDLLTRIRGPFMDHTHGARFLSVAEGHEGDGESTPARIDVALDDIDTAVANSKAKATLRYIAVDVAFTA